MPSTALGTSEVGGGRVKVGNDPAAGRRAVKLETASIATHPGGKVEFDGDPSTTQNREDESEKTQIIKS
jgi:hypothetical protein